MSQIAVTRAILEAAIAHAEDGLDVCIPVAVPPTWEPPHITEARVMWNATEREPYWPTPYIHTLKFDARLLRDIAKALPSRG